MVQIKHKKKPLTRQNPVRFISHMVQIKLAVIAVIVIVKSIFISHMVQIKLIIATIIFFSTNIYIPHGSDKTCKDTSSIQNLTDLYPTWFR